MEALKFRKIRFFSIVLFIVLAVIVFFAIRVIMGVYYENRYFTEGREYNKDDVYLNQVPIQYFPNTQEYFKEFENLIFENSSIKIPKESRNDSIKYRFYNKNKALSIKYFSFGKVTKSLILTRDSTDVSNALREELLEIGLIGLSNFDIYRRIYNHVPNKKNLIFQNTNEMKENLKLSSLKEILYVNGIEKKLSVFESNSMSFFQFCSPELCLSTIVKIFLKGEEITIISKGFDQTELDYIVLSIKSNNS